jgi:hypothetical protein
VPSYTLTGAPTQVDNLASSSIAVTNTSTSVPILAQPLGRQILPGASVTLPGWSAVPTTLQTAGPAGSADVTLTAGSPAVRPGPGAVTLDAGGLGPMSVTITGGSWFTNEGLTAAASFPLTVATSTVVYPAAPASVTISGTAGGVTKTLGLNVVAGCDETFRFSELLGSAADTVRAGVSGVGAGAFVQQGGGTAVGSGLLNSDIPLVWAGNLGQEARGIAISGRYAYIGFLNHMYVYDITTPSAPVLISDTVGGAFLGTEQMKLRGRYLYVTNRANQFGIVDVIDPKTPAAKGLITDNTRFTTAPVLDVKGTIAYVASPTYLSAIDCSDPNNPVLLGSVNFASTGTYNLTCITVQGKYAYLVGSGTKRLTVMDVSNPASMTEVGALSGSGAARFGAVFGPNAYLVTNDTFEVVNIRNPAAPASISTLTDTSGAFNSPFRVAPTGRYVYCCNRLGNGVTIVDVANPAAPVVARYFTAVTPATLDHPVECIPRGRYLHVACGSFATYGILDISGFETGSAKIDNIAATSVDVAGLLGAGDLSVLGSDFVGGDSLVQGTVTAGTAFRYPRYTTAGRPTAASAGEGATIYDTTLHYLVTSDGTNWKNQAGTTV